MSAVSRRRSTIRYGSGGHGETGKGRQPGSGSPATGRTTTRRNRCRSSYPECGSSAVDGERRAWNSSASVGSTRRRRSARGTAGTARTSPDITGAEGLDDDRPRPGRAGRGARPVVDEPEALGLAPLAKMRVPARKPLGRVPASGAIVAGSSARRDARERTVRSPCVASGGQVASARPARAPPR